MYNKWIKRFLDFMIACIMLILLFPLMILLYILIYFLIGPPVLFQQTRPGFKEKPFQLYKFRTMRNLKNSKGILLDDDLRLTKFGKLLRSLSLDELPELINVLKGEMSLVGPRPLLMEYLPYYSDSERKRHQSRPGITGWAQVNGRNAISWKKKFELDIWYVENCSFTLDIKILFLTVIKTIKREGINANERVTMTRFDLESKNKMN